jgi:hypothetical protein
LPVETSDFRYFVRSDANPASVFLPEGLGLHVHGVASSVRIRQVLRADRDGAVVEGTLVSDQLRRVSPHDLIWIQLPLAAGRVDLYGHLYSAEGLAYGEARFRTVPQKLPASLAEGLRAAEGGAFPRTPFEIVPLLSTPCDLYALAVLVVRTLLVDDKVSLPIALDDALSLARQVAVDHDATVDLAQRVGQVFGKDKRWSDSLGPQRLTRKGLDPETAFKLLPRELWFETMGWLVGLFPGVGPDSVCKDYGDVPSLALETVFERPIADLEKLLARSRSLIIVDWSANRELHSVIKGFIERSPGP